MSLNIAELKKVFRDFDSGANLVAEVGRSEECVTLYEFLSQKKSEIVVFEGQIREIENAANIRAAQNVRDEAVAPEVDQPFSTAETEQRSIDAASINGFRDQIKQADNQLRNRLLEEAKTLETLDPKSEYLQIKLN